MPVAFDAVGPSSSGAHSAAATTLTFSHTITGIQTVLLAGIAVDAAADGSLTCTCTYNGLAMTSLQKWHSGGATQSVGYIQVFGIVAPAGTANVVATVAGGTPANMAGGSVSFTGAGQTIGAAFGTPATGDSNSASTTTATAALASNTSGNLIAGFICQGAGITSATAPSTSRFLFAMTGTGGAASCAGATSPATGSSVTMAWTVSSDFFAEIMVEVLPFTGGGSVEALPQQISRLQWRKRKLTQVPQFNLASPDVNILAQPVTAFASFPPAQVISNFPYITGLAGGGTGYFQDNNGNPRLVWGDAAWALCGNVGRWSSGAWQSDYDTYLATRAAQGCTMIYAKPMGTTQSGNVNDDGRDAAGLFPFQGGTLAAPSTGLTSSYWAKIDYFLASAAAKGITIFLNAIGYTTDFETSGPLSGKSSTEFQSYGTALGTRYASTPNIVWMVADDYFGTNDTKIDGFLTGLRGAGDTHVIAIENMPESDSRRDLGSSATLSWGNSNAQYNFVYTYAPYYLGVEFAYGEASPVPVIGGDGYFYQGSTSYFSNFDRGFRQDAWWALSSGARGAIHGDEGIWTWTTTSQAHAGNAWFWVNSSKAIADAFTSLTGWHLLIPDTSSVLVTSGRGTRGTPFSSGGGGGQYEPAFTDTYVSASRVPDGSLAVIYMSHATTIGIDQSKMITGYTATWIDPVSGAKTGATPGASYNSTAKGNNSAGDPDWVLALQAPPGGLLPQQLRQAAARRMVSAPDAGARATYT